MEPKKLLIISAAFPPCGGPGVKRTLKLLKFFPENGWMPEVLTEKNGVYTIYDPSLLKEIPSNVRVLRTSNFFNKFCGIVSAKKIKNGDQKIKQNKDNKKNLKIKKRLLRKLKEFFIIPDGHIFWLPSAISKGIKIIRNENISGIYATGDPFSNHIIGSLLKRMTKLPLMLDFRDAWIADPAVKRSKVRNFLEAKLEKYCIETADKVVAVTEGVTEDFKKRYGCKDNYRKFITITNGYDKDDVRGWEGFGIPEKDFVDQKKLTVVHTGRLMGERTPKYFLKALKLAIDEGISADDIEVIFVGDNTMFNDGRHIEEYITEYDLKKYVRLTGFIPRRRSMWYQFKADILLLIIGIVDEDKVNLYGLAGKIFDYMLANKPILVLGDSGGPAEKLVRKTNIGNIIQSRDVEGLKEYIKNAVEKHKKGLGFHLSRRNITDFDMRYLTADMANNINDMIKNDAKNSRYKN